VAVELRDAEQVLVAVAQERDIDHELAEVGSWWWSQETQAALHRMVEQLAMKKKA
jgi:hypothetical protein